MSIASINNNESGSSVRTKLNSAIAQLNSGSFDTVSATNNGNGTNFKIGDDIWLGDVNISDTFQVKGVGNGTRGFIKFGSGSNSPVIGGVAGSNLFQVTGSVEVSSSLNVLNNITASMIYANINGTGTNFKVGDDAYIGDINVVNTMQVSGQQDGTKAFIKFGSGSATPIVGTTGDGQFSITGGLKLQSGSNTPMGTVTLNGGNPGTATISNSLVTSASLIFLTKQTFTHINSRGIAVVSKNTGTFTISSGHNGDTDVVAYMIINPNI